ncbi:MAG TPA: LysR substrate-binding domain-containing protein [Mariprofundaceae bacterium]|nr:LysR substrate-binding domain-containing protein [Mariprofundaceae bacterium]
MLKAEAQRMLPTLKQLRFLIALDEQRHFSKAAKACFVSQSAFSIAIKELETKLQVHLVDRTNRSVTFTEIGQAIVDQARRCMAEIETLVAIAESRQQPLSGRLTLGVIPTIAPFLLPTILPEIHRKFPQLQLYLREEKSQLVYEQLLEGKLDLILMALPYEMKGVVTMPLYRDPFLFANCQKSQWVKKNKAPIDIDELPDESVLLLDDGHCLRDHALQACRLNDSEQISRFSATSLQTLLQMVASDIGVTFIPDMAKDSLILKGSNIELSPMPTESYREIGLAWRKGSARADEFRLFGSLLQHLHHEELHAS